MPPHSRNVLHLTPCSHTLSRHRQRKSYVPCRTLRAAYSQRRASQSKHGICFNARSALSSSFNRQALGAQHQQPDPSSPARAKTLCSAFVAAAVVALSAVPAVTMAAAAAYVAEVAALAPAELSVQVAVAVEPHCALALHPAHSRRGRSSLPEGLQWRVPLHLAACQTCGRAGTPGGSPPALLLRAALQPQLA